MWICPLSVSFTGAFISQSHFKSVLSYLDINSMYGSPNESSYPAIYGYDYSNLPRSTNRENPTSTSSQQRLPFTKCCILPDISSAPTTMLGSHRVYSTYLYILSTEVELSNILCGYCLSTCSMGSHSVITNVLSLKSALIHQGSCVIIYCKSKV